MATMQIAGLRELHRKLKQLEGKLAKKALRKGLRGGAKDVQAAAKALAPTDSGDLAANIKVRTAKLGRGGRGMVGVSVQSTAASFGRYFYPPHIEFGTDEVEAQSYMRRAADERRRHAVAIIATVTGREIDAQARRTA